jgi:hypothetical protein
MITASFSKSISIFPMMFAYVWEWTLLYPAWNDFFWLDGDIFSLEDLPGRHQGWNHPEADEI